MQVACFHDCTSAGAIANSQNWNREWFNSVHMRLLLLLLSYMWALSCLRSIIDGKPFQHAEYSVYGTLNGHHSHEWIAIRLHFLYFHANNSYCTFLNSIQFFFNSELNLWHWIISVDQCIFIDLAHHKLQLTNISISISSTRKAIILWIRSRIVSWRVEKSTNKLQFHWADHTENLKCIKSKQIYCVH